MFAWRLCRRPFADLLGEGARQYGGRWNSPGRPMLYAASNAALCVLEVRVHLDLPFPLIPPDYVLMTIDLTGLETEAVGERPADTVSFGDRWLREGRTPVLEVPSSIVAESTNLLLNPAHPDAAQARIGALRAFSFDQRLWTDA